MNLSQSESMVSIVIPVYNAEKIYQVVSTVFYCKHIII